ncbi:MAG: aminotransferase class I/II-fold pyridoxal phosphate-dependent enzyme, partial [Candidatus Omnitrophica bacterium]|nr:aminotransferase class I/II-fold pyridoxal phosphate-dependent enzyme [Candidatus Omnitrophota bacterium]
SVINASIAAIDAVKKEPFRRTALLANAAHLRGRLREKGLDVKGESQIVPVILGKNPETARAGEKLREKGYWVTPVRPPTVPKGTARLRISVTCDHTRDVLEKFADDLCDILEDRAWDTRNLRS